MPAYRRLPSPPFPPDTVRSWSEPADRSWISFTTVEGRVVFFANRNRFGAVLPYSPIHPYPTAGQWRTGERCPF
jgi:hypothetical protein